MNAQPHTHELITIVTDGCLELRYGDTVKTKYTDVGNWSAWHLRLWLEHEGKKIIRRHDRGSIRAGKRQEARKKAVEHLNQVIKTKEWND